MNYKIAICDDCSIDRQNLHQLVRTWAESRSCFADIEAFDSAEAFWFHYSQNHTFDLILLDIEMPGMDGVSLAKKIRQDDRLLQIVFITGYSDYIAEGYEVSALHYLMKPVHADKLMQVMDRAVERLHREERMLTLKNAEETIRIPLSNIYYLEAARNYVTVHAENMTDFVVRRKLSDFEAELDQRFLKIGRSYILNLAKLQRITRTEVSFPDGKILPLPRGAYDILNRAIIERL